MYGMRRILIGGILFLVVVATLVFVLENRQMASLVLFGWSTPEMPIAVFIVLALLLGMLASPLVGLLIYGRMRVQLASRQRQLAECREKLGKLSNSALAD